MNTDIPMIREAVAVFRDKRSLEDAIFDLETHGFDRAEISLLAPVPAVEKELGHLFRSVRDLEDDVHVPMVAYTAPESIGDAEGALAGGLLYVGALASLIPVVASGGTIAAAMIAMSVGGGVGASVGALLARLLDRNQASRIEEQLEHGGLLLWVRTWNEGDERRAVEILSAHSGEDVHVHSVPETDMDADRLLAQAAASGERKTYRGEPYVSLGAGGFYADGKVFPTEAALRRFLDRRAAVGSVPDGALPGGATLGEALTDPARVFGTLDRLKASSLPAPLKSDLLRRWAYDVKQQLRATGEGMPSDTHEVPLADIENALRELAAGAAEPVRGPGS